VSSKIFNEHLVAVHKIKETLKLDKPAFVGMCILDISKTLMYDFHYNYIKNKCSSEAKLLFTDTDSLIYEIQKKMLIKIFGKIKISLIIVITQKIVHFMMKPIKTLLENLKIKLEVK